MYFNNTFKEVRKIITYKNTFLFTFILTFLIVLLINYIGHRIIVSNKKGYNGKKIGALLLQSLVISILLNFVI